MYDPASVTAQVDEQEFVQAYENVREKYKGTRAAAVTVRV